MCVCKTVYSGYINPDVPSLMCTLFLSGKAVYLFACLLSVYRKRGKIRQAELPQFSRVLQKFFHDYLFISSYNGIV